MNHEDARVLIGADPGRAPSELAQHLETCPECLQFQREMIALDTRIRRALQEPASLAPTLLSGAERGTSVKPTPLTAMRRVWRRRPMRSRGWAAAASAAVAVLATIFIWTLRPVDTLAFEVVTHIEGEPNSWTSTEAISTQALDAIMQNAGIVLESSVGRVMYARSCLFRGHAVPHLVVMTAHGPVTVLVLRHDNVDARETFHEDGMTGVITPAPHGSLAVLSRGNQNLDEVVQQMRRSIRFLPAVSPPCKTEPNTRGLRARFR